MTDQKPSEYLTAKQVRARFGDASAMWIHRRIKNDGFPEPVRFGARLRHFRLTDIEKWEAMMIARGTVASRPGAKA